jgi:hypothetical protein
MGNQSNHNTEGTKGMPDDVRRADESGEPAVDGRSRGMVIDDKGAPAGAREQPGKGEAGGSETAGTSGRSGKVGDDYESGRQDAAMT